MLAKHNPNTCFAVNGSRDIAAAETGPAASQTAELGLQAVAARVRTLKYHRGVQNVSLISLLAVGLQGM